ncbi:MAG: hypothetical protein GY772_20665 [bacterium]|jgi:hypothetical protein|nr:hypothetical protein [Roseobacter sp.]MCP4242973.1 hypothetical protein [bacterium]HJO22044.1 hypothetical protein [Myxococcota bacterium]|tara:strand:+ start:376 stop:564 length:189 start_codon:yes stop_codon:yes gene_type:complete
MVEWLTANWQEIADIVAKVIAAAAAISAITPSRSDNEMVSKILGFLNLLGLNVLKARNADDS